MGHMFLILVDAHSKWLDVRLMQSISSTNTIEKLRMVLAFCFVHFRLFDSINVRDSWSYNCLLKAGLIYSNEDIIM